MDITSSAFGETRGTPTPSSPENASYGPSTTGPSTSDDALRASIVRSQSMPNVASRSIPAGQDLEQWGAMAAGGLLAWWGLNRRSIPGLAVAAAGGLLFYRGLVAYQCAHRAWTHCGDGDRPDPMVEYQPVDEASWESFPASDPPSFSSGTS